MDTNNKNKERDEDEDETHLPVAGEASREVCDHV